MTLLNGDELELYGARANGKRYVLVASGGCEALVPLLAWHNGSNEASACLVAQGIVVLESMRPLREAVAQLKRFRRALVADRPGWTGGGFALPSGELLSADDRRHLTAYPPAVAIMTECGSLEDWRINVAAPLADHLFASFCMMVPFAAPLLRLTNRADNFGFELSGPAGRGKSTLQLLMASTAGRTTGGDGSTYWRTCNATLNALEVTMSRFNDLPLILDEAGLIEGSGRSTDRAREMRSLAFRLSAGRVKDRLNEVSGPQSRLIYVISTNSPSSAERTAPKSC